MNKTAAQLEIRTIDFDYGIKECSRSTLTCEPSKGLKQP